LSTRRIVCYEVIRFTIGGCALAILDEAPTVELDSDTSNMITRLTGRELQVFRMIAQGDTVKNVAHKLRISEWTVGTHLRRIFAKLDVDNQAAMVYRCALLIDSALRTEPGTRREPVSED
jgi:DNA-binding CsgD family transcriptional regulator